MANRTIAKVGENIKSGTIDKDGLSGPVITYHLNPEEIVERYGPVGPPRKQFHKTWPTAGQPNKRHPSKRYRLDEEVEADDESYEE